MLHLCNSKVRHSHQYTTEQDINFGTLAQIELLRCPSVLPREHPLAPYFRNYALAQQSAMSKPQTLLLQSHSPHPIYALRKREKLEKYGEKEKKKLKMWISFSILCCFPWCYKSNFIAKIQEYQNKNNNKKVLQTKSTVSFCVQSPHK